MSSPQLFARVVGWIPRREAGEASSPWSWLRRVYTVWLLPVSVLLGAVLRIREWLFDKSLWNDEILVAGSITRRGLLQLTQPLPGGQAAPIGWLWAERLVVDVFGASELTLRLVPLLASLVTLAIFPQLAHRLVGPAAAPFATLLVATSPPLIYYAAETKQYSSDTTCALLVLLATTYLVDRSPTVRSYLYWGLACGALSWCSQPTILVAAACALGLVIRWIRRRGAIGPLVAGIGLLGVILAAEWFGPLRAQAASKLLQNYWQGYGGFPRQPATIHGDLSWVGKAGVTFTHGLAELALPALALILLGWGFITLCRTRPWAALLLGLVGLAAVGAAVTYHYPLAQRLALYLVPVFILMLTAGLADAEAATRHPLRRPWRLVAPLLCAAALLLTTTPAIASGLSKLWHPDETTAVRQAVEFVGRHQEPGDIVLTDVWARAELGYYGSRSGVSRNGDVTFRATRPVPCIGNRLAPLAGHRRVWLLLTHHPSDEPANRNAIYASQFDAQAARLLSFYGAGDVAAYLFDLGQPPATPAPPLQPWLRNGCFTVALTG